MNYIITGDGFISPEFQQLKNQKDLKIFDAKELSKSTVGFSNNDKVYISTEAALESVLEKLNYKKRKITALLKDKFACRNMLRLLYPSFYFAEVPLNKLSDMNFDKNKKYVVKPKMGFFNAGVRIFTGKSNIKNMQESIKTELSNSSRYFSPSVLSATELLIEEYIGGSEFAVDMFYSSTGKPVIVNIYKHPTPKYKDYFHVVYYSHRSFFDKYLEQFTKIFTKLNDCLEARSLPIHAEFKYSNNKFVPIEFNPMRYGGMGLADLTYYAYDFNPFLAYFNDAEPDWKEIWNKRNNKYYAWVLAYNGTKVDVKKDQPDHEKLQGVLGKILHYNKLDYKTMPVFANAYIETDKEKISELLELDFNDFFNDK